MALYIITISVLLVGTLLLQGMTANNQTDQLTIATVIATKRMASVRDWAAQGNNFANWAPLEGLSYADDEYPDYIITTNSEALTQYSPCSLEELRYPAGNQRTMTHSARKVRVRVTWDPSHPNKKADLVGIVGAPDNQTLASVSITPNGSVPNPVNQLQTASFQVQGLDSSGGVIQDLFFDWWVVPQTGTGTFSALSRDGRTTTFENLCYFCPYPSPGQNVFAPAGSTCQVATRAFFRGAAENATYNITLGGP